jgi:hypothetical protein
MTKQIKADLDQAVEAILNAIYKPQRTETTIIDDIRTALEQFVVEENTKTLLDLVREVMAQKDKSHSQITDEIIKVLDKNT